MFSTILATTDGGSTWQALGNAGEDPLYSILSGLSYLFAGFKMPEILEKTIIE